MESKNIKVSVVVPVYNMEKYIEECAQSLLAQTLKDIEIVFVDDGSTDSSRNLLEKIAKKDDRVIILHQKNSGVGNARNAGIKIAQGEYLSILDADDFFEPDMLENSYAKAKADNSDVVIFKAKSFDEDTGKTEDLKWCRRDYWIPQTVFSYKDVPDRLFCLGALWAWDKLFRTDFIKHYNIEFQNQRTCNDARFVVLALSMAERISTCDNAYAIHRVNRKDSLSVTRELSWDCFYKAFLSCEKHLRAFNRYNEVIHAMRNWVVDFTLWNYETITGKHKKDIFYLFKNDLSKRYSIFDYQREYYLWPEKYDKALKIKELSFEEYENISKNTLLSKIHKKFLTFKQLLRTQGLLKTLKYAAKKLRKRLKK